LNEYDFIDAFIFLRKLTSGFESINTKYFLPHFLLWPFVFAVCAHNFFAWIVKEAAPDQEAIRMAHSRKENENQVPGLMHDQLRDIRPAQIVPACFMMTGVAPCAAVCYVMMPFLFTSIFQYPKFYPSLITKYYYYHYEALYNVHPHFSQFAMLITTAGFLKSLLFWRDEKGILPANFP